MGLSGAEIVFIALGLLLLVLLVAAICIAIFMIIRSSQKNSSTKLVEPPVFPPPALASVQHTEQQLRSLAKLRDEGVITPEDFEAKKRTLLGI